MANKVFALVSTADREVALEVGLIYPLNAAKKKWMEEVIVIFFGPSEKLAANDIEVQGKIKELLENGIEVIACKWCSDRMNITPLLENLGIRVEYVGSIITELIKGGWAQLTF